MRLLIVEDNVELSRLLASGLMAAGYESDIVNSVAEARDALRSVSYAAMILDLGLPDGDGLSVLSELRRRSDPLPVLVLTARNGLQDRVNGLRSGADDYLGKPFAFEELLARLRALLRRPANVQQHAARIGRLSFDFTHREASVDGCPLEMPRRERLVLETLLHRMGRMVQRSALMEAVYGLDDDVQPNALDTHVSRLRRRLTEADAGVTINGVRGLGYVLRETP